MAENIDNIEIRKVKNGYLVSIHSENDSEDYVFDNIRKTLRFLKDQLDPKSPD